MSWSTANKVILKDGISHLQGLLIIRYICISYLTYILDWNYAKDLVHFSHWHSLIFFDFHTFMCLQLRCLMRKSTFCIGESKEADHQHLCFRYLNKTIPLLLLSKISRLKPSLVALQPGLCQTWSESTLLVFSHCSSIVDGNEEWMIYMY